MPRIPQFGHATAHTASISDGSESPSSRSRWCSSSVFGAVRHVALAALDDAAGPGAEVVGEALVAEGGEDAEQRAFHALSLWACRSAGSGSGSGGGAASGGGSSRRRRIGRVAHACPPYQAAMLTAPMP